jgi:hypothetical protein
LKYRLTLLLLLLSAPCWAWDKGFNFRATSGFVTDSANQTYVLCGETFPTNRNSADFGWDDISGCDSRDRDSGIDVRLAGIHFYTVSRDFKVTLPSAGVYDIYLALGDASGTFGGFATETIYDNTTLLATITAVPVSSGDFIDATGTNYSTANWPGSNTKITKTFATTNFILRLDNSGNARVAHLRIVQVSTPTIAPRHRVQNQ